jgi:hypothetical protein
MGDVTPAPAIRLNGGTESAAFTAVLSRFTTWPMAPFFTTYLIGVGRYNTAYNGLLRVYLNQPRTYRLSATFEF